jgi:hypothetical protein
MTTPEILSRVVFCRDQGRDRSSGFLHDPIDKRCSSHGVKKHGRSVESSPSLLSGLCEVEDHHEAGLSWAVAFRLSMPQTKCGEDRFDWVRRANVRPVLGGEIE